jgi:hypothetical protein
VALLIEAGKMEIRLNLLSESGLEAVRFAGLLLIQELNHFGRITFLFVIVASAGCTHLSPSNAPFAGKTAGTDSPIAY